MAKLQSQGKCQLCHATFTKAAMSRHLAKCLSSQEAAGPAVSKAKPRTTKLFHLVVQGRYLPHYWLHLEVPATATLYDLDDFLRAIWLECCGHLSAFTIDGTRYSVQPISAEFGWEAEEEQDMGVKLQEVFRPGLKLTYEYDFGSTTDLELRVVSEREGPAGKKNAIRLLARNDPPAILCAVCAGPATQVSTEAAWDESGWLCDRCAEKSDFDPEMFLPVVNSPRVGVCGYTGE
jgi:hypothetical protein